MTPNQLSSSLFWRNNHRNNGKTKETSKQPRSAIVEKTDILNGSIIPGTLPFLLP